MCLLQSTLQSAFDEERLAVAEPGAVYHVDAPIVIDVDRNRNGPIGFDGNGCKIVSALPAGCNQPVITYRIDKPNINLRYFQLRNFTLFGGLCDNSTGGESDGLVVECATNDSWVYSWVLDNINFLGCKRTGMRLLGSIFEGSVQDVWCEANGEHGCHVGSVNGGVISAICWRGGGFRNNTLDGLVMDGGCNDLKLAHTYFCQNKRYGLNASNGITQVVGCGFENNGLDGTGYGAGFQSFATFRDCSFSTYGPQMSGVGGFLVPGGTLILDNCGTTNYGPSGQPMTLARVTGQGRVLTNTPREKLDCGPDINVVTTG